MDEKKNEKIQANEFVPNSIAKIILVKRIDVEITQKEIANSTIENKNTPAKQKIQSIQFLPKAATEKDITCNRAEQSKSGKGVNFFKSLIGLIFLAFGIAIFMVGILFFISSFFPALDGLSMIIGFVIIFCGLCVIYVGTKRIG